MEQDIVLSDTKKQNPAAVYLRSLQSPTSRSSQKDALNLIARKLLKIETAGRHPNGVGTDDFMMVDWSLLRYEHTSALQTWLAADYAAATARRCIAAIRGTLKAAWRLNQIADGDYLRAIDLSHIAGESSTGRMLSPEEVGMLLATCAKGGPVIAARDAAILTLMVLYTARRAEVTTIQMSDYTADYKPGLGRLVLHGKGNKDREVFLANGERDILADWLKIRGTKPGAIFYTVLKSDEILKKPLTPIAVYVMVLRRMKRAGIENATPHDLRRTAISNLLDITDALTAARIAGHGSATVTMRYDMRGERSMIEALSKMHLPFRQKNPLAAVNEG